MTVLSDGRTVMVWTSGTEVRARVFNPDGSATGSDFAISSGSADSVGSPMVSGTPDGGFVVVWSSTTPGPVTNVFTRAFDIANAPKGAEVNVESTVGSNEANPSIAKLVDGTSVVIWQEGIALRMKTVAADGTTLGSIATVNVLANATTGISKVAGLDDGNFVVTWESSGDIYGRTFLANGTAVGTEFVINNAIGTQGQPNITALDGGRFIAVWTSNEGGNLNEVRARIYDADGIGGTDFLVNTTAAGNQSQGSVTKLDDGRLVFVFTSEEGASTEIRARLMTDTGAVLGNDFLVNTVTAGVQDAPHVVSLTDGRFMVAWGSGDDISSQIYDPKSFIGTAAADIWVGGTLNDTMYGLGGNDDFSGGLGADLLHGGDGTDKISGGADNDKIYGDSGDDKTVGAVIGGLFGGDGNDRIEGGSGNDSLNGENGDDLLIGGIGVDTYIGGLGVNTVSYEDVGQITLSLDTSLVKAGAAAGEVLTSIQHIIGSATGSDVINGDATGNRLFGLGGNDTLRGQNGSDQLQGGVGIDTLDGGAGNDTIYGGFGNDIIQGGLNDDIIFGGVGADAIDGGLGVDTLSYFFDTVGITVALSSGLGTVGAAAGDTVAGIENVAGTNFADSIFGDALNNRLDGAAGDDFLSGGSGNDRLTGGVGNDTLVGGLGVDTLISDTGIERFRYNSIAEGGDIINIFVSGGAQGDKFVLDDASFTRFTAGAAVNAANLKVGTTDLAADANDYLIFNTVTDKLWYDADGTGAGAAVLIADMTGHAGTFSVADFEII